jgi:hypothetical protein
LRQLLAEVKVIDIMESAISDLDSSPVRGNTLKASTLEIELDSSSLELRVQEK